MAFKCKEGSSPTCLRFESYKIFSPLYNFNNRFFSKNLMDACDAKAEIDFDSGWKYKYKVNKPNCRINENDIDPVKIFNQLAIDENLFSIGDTEFFLYEVSYVQNPLWSKPKDESEPIAKQSGWSTFWVSQSGPIC